MSAGRDITISVVIPCYNAAPYLHETISSALEQSLPPLEVLVVDDGSTDDSAHIAASFGAPVRVIRQANAGESVARNRGFDEAAGTWVAFLDADDLWRPEKLEQQSRLVESNVVCVHTAVHEFGTRSRVTDVSTLPPSVRYNLENLSIKGLVHPSSAMVRKSAKARFPDWTQYAEDQFYFLDLSREGEFRMVSAPLTGHRNHGANQSSRVDIEVHRHEAILQWLQKNEEWLGERQIANIRRRRFDGLVYEAISALAVGRFETYQHIRRYARRHGSFFPVACRVVAKAVVQQTYGLVTRRRVILPY